ncbi:MAG: ABC transporter substrate-binding protein [Oscillospiraceae bacterium]|nr:ABC transporter substrate-binding protein [Oscillospiraceae bacterium]
MKKIFALILSLAMVLSLCACAGMQDDGEGEGSSSESTVIGDSNNDGQIEVGTVEDVEVNTATEHMDSWEACTSGNWEAMFVPTEIADRAIDLAGADITPTAEEKAAMEKEPAYGQKIMYLMSDGCTSGPTIADDLGYFTEAGITAEGVKGTSDVEGLGTGQVTVAVGHLAKMLVPITNGVDLTFVGGGHIGCKSLYVLGDSEYKTTADLKGTKISVPNGIGKSDYNITALLLDADGIHYKNDVELVQVSSDACITAMENGEISACLLSDSFAYAMVKEGKLRCVRSLLDADFQSEVCCVVAMNGTYVKENPVHAKKILQAVQKAHCWVRENTADATTILLEKGWNGGNYDMNVMLNNSMQFGLSQAFTERTVKAYIDDYIRMGLIESMDDPAEVLELAWTPVL